MLRPGTFVNLHFTDDAEIKKLNRKYRQKDEATDVLSFNFDEDTPEGGHYLGDIVINLNQARRQAKTAGHSLEEEVAKLAEHAVLHLLGIHH